MRVWCFLRGETRGRAASDALLFDKLWPMMKMNLADDEEDFSSSSDENQMDQDDAAAEDDDYEAAVVALQQRPFDYDAHVQLIARHRGAGQFEELQEARRAFKEKFALSTGTIRIFISGFPNDDCAQNCGCSGSMMSRGSRVPPRMSSAFTRCWTKRCAST